MVEESHMSRVLQMVWNATLHLSLGAWDSVILKPDPRAMLAACVRISGAWGGTICIHAPEVIVRYAAALMFGKNEAQITRDDMRDAFGELANQVGGNLKVLLPGPCQLSLPEVMDGKKYFDDMPDSDLLIETAAECNGLPILVTLVETLPSREAFHQAIQNDTTHSQ